MYAKCMQTNFKVYKHHKYAGLRDMSAGSIPVIRIYFITSPIRRMKVIKGVCGVGERSVYLKAGVVLCIC